MRGPVSRGLLTLLLAVVAGAKQVPEGDDDFAPVFDAPPSRVEEQEEWRTPPVYQFGEVPDDGSDAEDVQTSQDVLDQDEVDATSDDDDDEDLDEPPVPPPPRANCHLHMNMLETRNKKLEAKVLALTREVHRLHKQRTAARRHAAKESIELQRLRAVVGRQEAMTMGASPPADAAAADAPAASLEEGTAAQAAADEPQTAGDADDARASPAAADSSAVAFGAAPVVRDGPGRMPWLLTHMATRHKAVRRGSGGWSPLDGMTSLYNTLSGSTAQQQPEALTVEPLALELQRTREDLGRMKEEKQQLERRVEGAESKEAQEEAVVKEDVAKLAEANEHEKVLEAEVVEAKRVMEEAPKQDKQELIAKQVQAQVEQATKDIEAKADIRVQEESSQRAALEEQLKEEQLHVAELQNEVYNLQNRTQQLQDQLEEHKEVGQSREKLESERRQEEDTMKASMGRLQRVESGETQCMTWGKRLEKKLQHVLMSRKNDARLCRDSIAGLHEERRKLRDERHHIQAEAAAAEKKATAAQKQSEEDAALLNRCLDTMQPR